ncbi:MAG: hypothetical protein NC321_13000 [Clostridium sp.]|nr:hypothetical protein [Clostridium sp.]
MRKRTKKLALTLLLSVAMLSMNMNFVYAEEMGMSDSNIPVGEAASAVNTSADVTAADSTDNTEQAEKTEEAAETAVESAVTDENAAQQTVTDGNTETTGESGAAGTETGTQTTDETGTQTTDGTGTADGSGDVTDGAAGDGETTDGTADDGIAAADGAETDAVETSEKVYVNQAGEEVVPSTLVGVDYTTIADSYDGVENVIKQYALSDTYAKDTVMDSYVDENGNLIMIICQGAAGAAEAEDTEKKEGGILETIADALGLDAEMGSSSDAPPVDGTFSGWDDIPLVYEMNNEDSGNCWVNGYWITNQETGETEQHICEQGTYDNVVRHAMQLYCDGDNVYLKITYASIYGGIWAFSPSENEKAAHGNGDDFNFYIDGVDTKFEVTQQGNGEPITNWTPEAGTYVVDVRHGNFDPSYSLVDGAVAYYHVTETGVNNSLELKIPMEAFQTQNGSVNLDNFSMVQFFTPNLMRDRLTAAGSPTGAEPFAAAVFLLVPASYVWLKKRDNKEDMAFA